MRYLRRLFDEYRVIQRFADGGTFLLYVAQTLRHAPAIVRTKTLTRVDESMRGHPCRMKLVNGKTITMDGSYFGLLREICCRRIYFALPGFDIASGDIVVDLGANVGVFSTIAALCGEKVVAVEAQSEFLPIMRHNFEINGCTHKANIVHGLIGGNSGMLSDPEERHKSSDGCVEPEVISVEDILARNQLTRVDFMKIDIEGSEFDLFSGDVSWLSTVRRIAMEVHPEFGDVRWLAETIKNNGFAVWLTDPSAQQSENLGRAGGFLFAVRN